MRADPSDKTQSARCCAEAESVRKADDDSSDSHPHALQSLRAASLLRVLLQQRAMLPHRDRLGQKTRWNRSVQLATSIEAHHSTARRKSHGSLHVKKRSPQSAADADGMHVQPRIPALPTVGIFCDNLQRRLSPKRRTQTGRNPMYRRLAVCFLSFAISCGDSATTGQDSDGGDPSSMSPSASGCSIASCGGEGQACVQDRCVTDCRIATASACSAGKVCDFTDGRCVEKDSPGVLTGGFQECIGPNGKQQCGPGSLCSLDGHCAADGPCSELSCDETGRCYGTSCPTTRPTTRPTRPGPCC